MGSLNLPSSGRLYIDTQVVVYTVERHPEFFPLVLPLWEAVEKSNVSVVTSELTILEMLVHPLRHKDHARIAVYEQLVLKPGFTAVPISQDILRVGAKLRAATKRLRTPDAIHIATAESAGCELFITNDAGLRGVTNISTVILNDLRPIP